MTRVLIVRLGALGDIVHAVPVAAALRRALPGVHLDWLVSAKHKEILDLVPVLDRRIAINDRAGAAGGLSITGAIRELRRAQYDLALDVQGLIKSAAVARLSGATRVVGFGARHLREPLARFFYTSAHDPASAGLREPGPIEHVVDLNLSLLRAIGIEPGPAEFPFAVVPGRGSREVAERTGGRYALLNPGAAWPNKRWPPDRFGEIAAELGARYGLMSVVLWGPGERDLAERVAANASGHAIVAPQTTISDLFAIVQHAAVMVSGDTGPTHIGAALGTPIVGIYGPTRAERNGPWRPEDVTVSRADRCQCHHLRQCRAATMCLMDVQVDEVLKAVERRLRA